MASLFDLLANQKDQGSSNSSSSYNQLLASQSTATSQPTTAPTTQAAPSGSVSVQTGAEPADPSASSEGPAPQTPVLSEPAGGAPNGSSPPFDGVLVSWNPRSTAQERAEARSALGLGLVESIHTRAMQASGAGPIERVSLPPGLSAERAIELLTKRPGVAYAEKNWLVQAEATSNDPAIIGNQVWGMYGDASTPSNPYGSQAAEAWAREFTGSKSVYVGIIDEGYQYTHSDLAANAGTNPGEIAGNGIDDDGNGYVDDVYGWDFDGGNNTIYDGTIDDHGTHVAGTIGAKGGNNLGVAGVNWDVSLLSAKFLGRRSGSIADAIKAVDYFTDLKTRSGINLVATNNSWGSGGFSQGLYDAIARAHAANILFVAAAGNSSTSALSYPAGYNLPNVISVASIDSNGALSSFSNYGSSWVDLGAPGGGIYSTLPDNSYGTYSGTSMAAPHVTGALALMQSAHPAATMAQLKQALLESVAATPSLASVTSTGGRLNVDAAITRLGQLVGSSGSTTPTTPVISVVASDAAAAETGADPGRFSLSRSGDTAAELTVSVALTGSASNGVDYSSLGNTVTFAPGSATAVVVVTPIDDTNVEGPESVTLSLLSGAGYSISSSAGSASLTIADNDSLPSNSSEVWGTNGNDTLSGDGNDNLIGGVSKNGSDTGRGTVDGLTGDGGADTFVLADASRGSFYNDGNSKDQGFADYADIRDFNPGQGDKLQLRSGSQYLIRNNGADTELFLGDGNKVFSSADEFIARLAGVTLASGTGVSILAPSTSWITLV